MHHGMLPMNEIYLQCPNMLVPNSAATCRILRAILVREVVLLPL